MQFGTISQQYLKLYGRREIIIFVNLFLAMTYMIIKRIIWKKKKLFKLCTQLGVSSGVKFFLYIKCDVIFVSICGGWILYCMTTNISHTPILWFLNHIKNNCLSQNQEYCFLNLSYNCTIANIVMFEMSRNSPVLCKA